MSWHICAMTLALRISTNVWDDPQIWTEMYKENIGSARRSGGWRILTNRVNKAMPVCINQQFEAVGDLKLIENRSEVVAHSGLADE